MIFPHAQKFSLPALLVFALLSAGCASRSDNAKQDAAVTIVRIWPEYRTQESFDRISEYFTGAENTGGQIILRTHPENRAGFYFFTRLKTPADITGARIELCVIAPDSAEVKTYAFDAPLLRKGAVLLDPGLTGPDWPDAAAKPTAWRLRLLDSAGAVIVSEQSFLWSK